MLVPNFASGNVATASDQNQLRDAINDYFGTGFGDRGYGGNATGPNVSSFSVSDQDLPSRSIGQLITTENSMPGEWSKIRKAYACIDLHLFNGNSMPDPLPFLSNLEVGDQISANPVDRFQGYNSSTNISYIDSSRLTPFSSNMTTTNSVITDTRTNPWQSMIQHEFKVMFGSPDQARWFFNTGGQVRLNFSHSGGSGSAQTLDWKALINGLSQFVFDAARYYALTSNWTTIFSQNGTGPYAANEFLIQAKYEGTLGANGDKSELVKIRSVFLDNYAGGGDLIDGTITAIVDDYRSTGVFVRPQPTYCTTTNLEFFDQLVEFSTSFSANNIQRENSGQQFVTNYTVTRTSGQGDVDLIYENKSDSGLQVWINGNLYSPGQTVTTVNLSPGNPSFQVSVHANATNLTSSSQRTIQLRAVSQIQNTLDNIQFNTPGSFNTNSRSSGGYPQFTNGLYASSLQNYGVWGSDPSHITPDFVGNWSFNYPCNGNYRIRYSADNEVIAGGDTYVNIPGIGNQGLPGHTNLQTEVTVNFSINTSLGTPEVGGGSGSVRMRGYNTPEMGGDPYPPANLAALGWVIELLD